MFRFFVLSCQKWVTFLVGKREIGVGRSELSSDSEQEVVVTIMFDRSKFSELTASKWWKANRLRFI